MNILVITNMYPNAKVEWAGTFVKQQVESLRTQPDTQVDVLVVTGSITGGNKFSYVNGYFRLIKKLYFDKRKYDIVHSHHVFMTILYKLSLRKLPLVYTMHENNYFETNRFMRIVFNWCARNSSATIVVWKKMLTLFDTAKTSFIPSGVNTSIFRPIAQRDARKNLNLANDRIYLFFPAPASRPEKNATFLEKFVTQNKQYIQDNNIEIIWGGKIAYQDMPIYMNAADILLSFSDYESDGMTYKEAMACNLPVITFEAGNSTIYFNDKQTGTIIEKSPNALKTALDSWKGNRSNGREKLIGLEMDLDSVAKKLIALYKQLTQS